MDAIRAAVARDRAERKDRSEIEELCQRYEKLTPREREVLPLVAAGLLNKQVAGKLATTERTIKFHRAHIMKKAFAESVADVSGVMMRLAPSGEVLDRIGRLLEGGMIRPDVATVYALQDVTQAWKEIAAKLPGVHGMSPTGSGAAAHKSHGKIVLRVA